MINLGNHDVYANVFSWTLILQFYIFTKPWILDNGAIDHIVSNPKFFINSTSSPVSLVNLPTCSTTLITSKWSIQFNRDIKLEHVLCVPSFHLNFISGSKLIKTLNCCVVLLPNGCILHDLATGSGEQRGGFYYMKPSKMFFYFFHVSSNTGL